MTEHRLSLERIAQARSVIDPVFLDTPQFESQSLSKALGTRVIVKVETMNPIGSFKARGAHFLASQLPANAHITCATAGNFGQGLAHAARRRGLPITIFTSHDASPFKLARMRALGADVRATGKDFDDAHRLAEDFATETGALLVEDGKHPSISEGAGTIGIELLRWPEPLDILIVPVGDGALIGGTARWVKTHSPHTRVVGVSASGSPAMERSWRAGHVIASVGPTRTIADGLDVQTPFAEAVDDLRSLIDDFVLVDDEALRACMRLAQDHLGLMLEPSGAAGLAAVLAHPATFRNTLVATILTGGQFA